MCAQGLIEAERRKPPGNLRSRCLLKRSGASRPVIRGADANATGRLAPFRYFCNGPLSVLLSFKLLILDGVLQLRIG